MTVESELVQIFLQDAGYQFLLEEIDHLASQSALTPDEKEAAGSLSDIFRHIIACNQIVANQLADRESFIVNLIKLVEHCSLSPPQHRRVTVRDRKIL